MRLALLVDYANLFHSVRGDPAWSGDANEGAVRALERLTHYLAGHETRCLRGGADWVARQVFLLDEPRFGPALVFDRSVAVRTVGLSYRFNDGPVVPRVAVVGSDLRTVYPWLASPAAGVAAVSSHARLRVQIFPTGSAPRFFDFDLTGARGDARVGLSIAYASYSAPGLCRRPRARR